MKHNVIKRCLIQGEPVKLVAEEIGYTSSLIYKWIREYREKGYFSPMKKTTANALQNREMLDIIGNAVIEKYRVPGAHTGFLPYSTACESKEYVRINLQKVITWFK